MIFNRSMSRRRAAIVLGGKDLGFGVGRVSSFTVALRSLGLKLRTPNWIKADFMRLTTRVCSWTNPSRSRCGRLASSSSMVGTIATVQWPRSPRSQPRKPRFNIAVSSRSVLARRCSRDTATLVAWGFCIRSSVNCKLIEATILQLSRRLPHSIFFRAFHALAVDDGGGRTGFPLRSFATLLIERVVDSLQCAVICPQIEIVVDRAFRRQVFRDRAPLTPGPAHVH